MARLHVQREKEKKTCYNRHLTCFQFYLPPENEKVLTRSELWTKRSSNRFLQQQQTFKYEKKLCGTAEIHTSEGKLFYHWATPSALENVLWVEDRQIFLEQNTKSLTINESYKLYFLPFLINFLWEVISVQSLSLGISYKKTSYTENTLLKID